MQISQKMLVLMLGGLSLGVLVLLILIWRLPANSQDAIFSPNPQGCILPCIMNIIPGTTKFAQAYSYIAFSVPKEQVVNESEFWMKNGDQTKVFITLEGHDPRLGNDVEQINLWAQGSQGITTLGKMLNAGYIPSKVFRARVSGPNAVTLLITWGAQQQIVTIVDGSGGVSAQSPIPSMYVFSEKYQTEFLGDLRLTQHFDDEIHWLGLNTVDAYWNASSKK